MTPLSPLPNILPRLQPASETQEGLLAPLSHIRMSPVSPESAPPDLSELSEQAERLLPALRAAIPYGSESWALAAPVRKCLRKCFLRGLLSEPDLVNGLLACQQLQEQDLILPDARRQFLQAQLFYARQLLRILHV